MIATVAAAIRSAAALLESVSDTPRLDAELLMAHHLGVDRSDLLLNAMDSLVPAGFERLVTRRAACEPLAYITGQQAFWDLDLIVTPDVLIPRADSETLIEAAIAAFKEQGPCRIIDLGTGSGALLLAALSHWPDATGLGVDKSIAALAIAKRNAHHQHDTRHHTLAKRAAFMQRDWTRDDWLIGINGPFDLILCNPPYIATNAPLAPNVRDYEPHSALFAGDDGLDAYHIILPQIAALLRANGPESAAYAMLEIGYDQAAAVTALAQAAGLAVDVVQDLAGHHRALSLSAPHDGKAHMIARA